MLDTNRRVYVYFNLHKNVWSVRQNGKIVEHTKLITLRNARFLVGQAGRQRVIDEKQKNVHAGISGYITTSDEQMPEDTYTVHKVTYNPYKYKTFVRCASGEPVTHSDYARLKYDETGLKTTVHAIYTQCEGE
jgi:hypothetical protein